MVSKTCLGSLDHTSLSLSKNQEKKLLTTSPQTWKNYATTSSCKKNEKGFEVATSTQAQKKLYQNALCALAKCKLKIML
jgi:hypothetical protein